MVWFQDRSGFSLTTQGIKQTPGNPTNYSLISGLSSQTEVTFFLHCVRAEPLKIYDGLQLESDTNRKILKKVLEIFDEFTFGKSNRYVFNSQTQDAEEAIDAYLTVLCNLVKSCNF